MRADIGIPSGVAWVALTVDLLASAAWDGQSVSCARLVRFLMIEHLRAGGQRNGRLAAPYSRLVAFGISRRLISGAIAEAEQRGLVVVTPGDRRRAALFRLTFLRTRDTTATNHGVWREPTDEWRTFGVLFDP